MKLLGKRLGLTIIHTPKKVGSIFVPYDKKTREGKIKYIGDEVEGFNVDDRVIYDDLQGEKIKDPKDNEDLLIMNLDDIIARIEV